MIGNGLDYLGGALLIFFVAIFEVVAYVEPFIARWVVIVLLWKIYRVIRNGWR